MIKIFKLIILVALATLVGIWATKYHGYVMLVLADKSIKMNLVAFIFVIAIVLFLLVFGYRILKLTFSFPYLLFSWFMSLLTINKQEKFIDLIADISLNNNKLINKLNIPTISRITPKYLYEYILFRKIISVARAGDVKQLQAFLKQLDKQSFIYRFFDAYNLYLVQKFSDAQTKVIMLLGEKNVRFISNTVSLASQIALADNDDVLALKLLDKYDAYLALESEEKLIVLVLKSAKDVAKLTEIYTKSDATETLSRVYVEQLLKFEDMTLAQKFIKKQLNGSNLDHKMLNIYVNAFSVPIAKLYPKVCKSSNKDYTSVLILLDLAMLKSDNTSFKVIYDFIETKLKDNLSKSQLEKYNHILCRFYIKNGDTKGIDLSESRLVYRSY